MRQFEIDFLGRANIAPQGESWINRRAKIWLILTFFYFAFVFEPHLAETSLPKTLNRLNWGKFPPLKIEIGGFWLVSYELGSD